MKLAHRRKTAAAAALVAALLAGASTPSRAAGSEPYQDVALALGQRLVAFFPAVEGYVVSVTGGELFLDLAEKDLVRPGIELQVYRPGDDIIHPVTRQVLGSYEKTLGWLRITEVREKYSRGVLEGDAAGVAAGDRVRVSARRLRALLRFTGSAPGIEEGALAQALIARGDQSGRFTMIDEPAWAPTLASLGLTADAPLADPADLRRLGDKAPADLLLVVSTEPGPPPAVALTVRSLRTGTSLAEFRQPWLLAPSAPGSAPGSAPAPPSTRTPAPPAPASTSARAASEPVEGARAPAPSEGAAAASPAQPAQDGDYATRELSGPVVCFAAGNVLGEGRAEVVLFDGRALTLYRWEERGLAWSWEEARGGRRVISLDAADVDGDGRAEVVLSEVANARVRSAVRSWRNGALREVAALDGFYLRTAPREGGRAVLLGQRAGVGEALSGRVEEYRLAEGRVERVEGTALPSRLGIFGLGFAGDAVYSVGRDGYLTVLGASGATVWKSPRPYGGYPPPATAQELFGPSLGSEEAFDEEARAFQRRVVAERTPTGVRVAVPRNFMESMLVLPRHRSLGHGEVVVLEGSPEALEETRRSRPFDGYVADIESADLDGDGRREILFAVNRSAGFFSGERGKLVAWRLSVAEK